MKRIRLTYQQQTSLRKHLFRGTGNEEAAFLIADSVFYGDNVELIGRELIGVPPEGFIYQSPTSLQISPEFMSPIIKRCRLDGLSLIDIHSHPGIGHVGFSGIDDRGDHQLLPKIQQRVPGRHHGSIVMNAQSLCARIWCPGEDSPRDVDEVVLVGTPLEFLGNARTRTVDPERYHRQVLAYSKDGQQRLTNTTVAIVGCGGLGSIACQHLAYSGISRIIAVDPDHVEKSNLSRMPGARIDDVDAGIPKVEIAKRMALAANPDIEVIALQGKVQDDAVLPPLLEADIVLCCTDTLASRDFLNGFAVRYLRPLVDSGIDIKPMASGQVKVFGRITPVMPGTACLRCLGIITEAALDDEYKRQHKQERVPATIAQNGVVASLAVNEIINLVVGYGDPGCYGMGIEYQGHKGTVCRVPLDPDVACPTCNAGKSISSAAVV